MANTQVVTSQLTVAPTVRDARFAADLARFGPQIATTQPWSAAEARGYCRRLARSHYENFTVASWLVPRRLRPHLCNIYAYCRWADDLADEVDPSAASRALLDWWEEQLDDCYRGVTRHPVFIALGETIRQFRLPRQPFADLLVAFRRDQQQQRYDTFDELLDYCRYSACPVGHLVLHLDGSYDEPRARMSDSICTGLQLANFWQDVRRDQERGRVYLPREDCQRFGYEEAMLTRGACNEAFRRLMAAELERAEQMLNAGWPLVARVSRALRVDVELFLRGGLAVLQGIRRLNFDVWQQRPTVSRAAKLRMLASTLIGRGQPTAEVDT